MSRFLLACSLVAALVSTSDARRRPPPDPGVTATPVTSVSSHFAQPPDVSVRLEPRPDRAAIRDALIRARATNLAAFRAYVERGVFPSNTFGTGKLHVWRDAAGHYCAAATIIKASGQDALVAKVAEQDNFIVLLDVKQGPLLDWMLTSGFTQEEIDAIQEPGFDMRRERLRPVVVDVDKRKAEDARLHAVYAQVDKRLVADQRKSIDLAVDRLLARPTLAQTLLGHA